MNVDAVESALQEAVDHGAASTSEPFVFVRGPGLDDAPTAGSWLVKDIETGRWTLHDAVANERSWLVETPTGTSPARPSSA